MQKPGEELTDKYLTHDFMQEIVATEYGQMLKLTIPNLKKDDVPDPRYTAKHHLGNERPR